MRYNLEATMFKKLGYVALMGGVLIALPTLASAAGDSPFVTNQSINQWRASKLAGISVMGAEQKSIGSIQEVLIDHDGNAQTVVIGVGGFLGIGEKDVAVPFKTIHWRTDPRMVAETTPVSAPPAAGDAAAPATIKTDPAATEASQGYPDMAMLDMTKEQLQNAPEFHYAPVPARPDVGTQTAPKNDAQALAPATSNGTQKP
jgi:sporulation protein YlmC with PRC-barrel domain